MSIKDKIIAFDIDGTLALNNACVSNFSINHIQNLIKEGYHICLVTGRSIVSSIDIYRQCKMNSLCVLCNGALVYDPVTDHKIRNVTIPYSVVDELTSNQFLMDKIDDLLIEIDYETYALTGKIWKNVNYIGDFKKTLKSEPNAIVVMVKDPSYQQDVANIINQSLDYHYRYWYKQGEFYNIHFSKKEGVEEMLKYYNKTSEDLIFFGDGENDRELLQFAKRGIAMKNADDITKTYANEITDFTNEENGAVLYLLKIIEQEK